MTKSEFKKLVAKSPNINFLSQMEINVTFSKIGEPIKLKSLVDLYDYVYDQNEKWKGIKSVDTIICETYSIYKYFNFSRRPNSKLFKY